MAKIICATSGLTGILNASFELVDRLEAEGHQVIYTSPKDVGTRVEMQGIRFQSLPEITLKIDEDIPVYKGPFRKLYRLSYKIRNAAKRREKALLKIDPREFKLLLDRIKPDLLIIDVELHEYIFKAYAKEIPMILLSQWFSLWNRSGLPYLLHDTIPGEGWRGQKWSMRFSWQWIKIKRGYTFFKQRLLAQGTDRRSVLLALAKQEGFPLQLIKENYWPGPFTYDQLPVMSMTAKEMEFPHDERPKLFYTGPMVNEKRIEKEVKGSEAYQLADAFSYCKEQQASLIYCSVSTLHKGDVDFIEKLIEAVKDQKKWVLIIGMGGLIVKKQLENLPKNVFAFSYVPQLKVLKEADCSINHGGIHTINECIHFKVPMLIYSGKRSDQNGCAARVAYHQLGLKGDKDKDDAKAIRQKIEMVLDSDLYKKRVEKMHQNYLKYRENRSACKIINNCLAARKKKGHDKN